MRKIIHIDMDAFYASVDQRDFPELRGKPLAVGGSPDGRGVVATASYEARKYGVKSAMSSRNALQLCPDLIFTYPRFEVYKEVSNHIRSIFRRYTDLIEPLSLDEAYLDVTDDKLGIGSAIEIAKEIKQAIQDELNLTASAGVSVNKFVAKIASDINKPNGLTFIGPSKIVTFLEQLPIHKFFGVGKVTAKKMNQMGIFTGKDLKRFSELEMVQHFGKSGRFFYRIVRGEDDRPVKPNRISKSIGVEDTFESDLHEYEDMVFEIKRIAEKLYKRLDKAEKFGKTVTVKIKFADFTQITRSKTTVFSLDSQALIESHALGLLDKVDMQDQRVRLLGVTISNFHDQDIIDEVGIQLSLF
ncbi:DNA polymerase IV [Sphingobacterium lactis]|uniref:DNA polymerase IV n=1 Tax=Sphingobacterium lactis TaxID=797291 RepID=UPI003DA3FF38